MTPPLASSTPPSSRLAGVDSTDLSDVFGLRSRRAAAGAPDSATAGVVLYKLQVHLRCGKNLVAKDACGKSTQSRLLRESLDPRRLWAKLPSSLHDQPTTPSQGFQKQENYI